MTTLLWNLFHLGVALFCLVGWATAHLLKTRNRVLVTDQRVLQEKFAHADRARMNYFFELALINQVVLEELYGVDMRGETSMAATASQVLDALKLAREQAKNVAVQG